MTTGNSAVIARLEAENHALRLQNQNLEDSNKSYSNVLEQVVSIRRQRDDLAEALSWLADEFPKPECYDEEKALENANKLIANLDSEPKSEIRQDIRDFINNQRPLGADVKQAVSENMDELLMKGDDSEPAKQPTIPKRMGERDPFSESYKMGWNFCRECVLQANTQPPAKQPAVPEGWSIEKQGSIYLVQKHDASGKFVKGEWIEPEQHGDIICELLSDMAQQGGRE